MLAYRHLFHAGNHADVVKHLVLVQALNYLGQKDKPWWYVDTHAGAGWYDLESAVARKNAEWKTGIDRLWGRQDAPGPVAEYLTLVRELNPDGQLRIYPGSPWLASRLAREEDRLKLFELHATDVERLRQAFAGTERQIRIEASDGFAGMRAVLPPAPRRALVLIDPPYEVKEDYRRVVEALDEGLRRFAVGVYVLWYPLVARPEVPRLLDRLKASRLKSLGVTHWLHLTFKVRATPVDGLGLTGSGLLVINPPWVLAERLREALPWLVKVLGQDESAAYQLQEQAE